MFVLKTTIEYLGYIISLEDITFSSRHTETINIFVNPEKL